MPRMLVIGWEQGCSCSCTTRMLGAALALEKAQVLGSVFFKCAQAGDARSVIIESPVPLWMNATRRPPAGRGGAGSYSDIRSRAPAGSPRPRGPRSRGPRWRPQG
jgi:hypothetical protein